MKLVELGKSVVDLQLESLKHSGLRIGQQGIYCIIAAVFGLFFLISFHALAWTVLMGLFGVPAWISALVVLFLDGAAALFFILLARNKKQNEAEVAVLKKRDATWHEFKDALAFTAFLSATAGPLGRYILKNIINLIIKKISNKYTKK